MQRRTFLVSLPLLAQGKYEPSWESLRKHQTPAWFRDAKLGIFIHWGLYSVPAFAPPAGELGKVDWNKWFYQNPYAEWYLNSLRLPDTPTAQHHAKTYGKDFDYYRFAETFNRDLAKWDPAAMAAIFKNAGAQYAVLTTKHHDGFTLWPSRVKHPGGRTGLGASRDLVGELTQAVRAAGLRMGLYYSGGLDWTFQAQPIAKMGDLRATIPQSDEYAQYADAHWRELIERYRPCSLWNDIGFPGADAEVVRLFADYYAAVPDGVVNDRFKLAPGPNGLEPRVPCDFRTPEYARVTEIRARKWELCRGIGHSFGWNRAETESHYLSPRALVHLLVDVVSKNGNLLLDVGPEADGAIPLAQRERLAALGAWLDACGDAIFGTRPWRRAEGSTADGVAVRFTARGDALYAVLLDAPKGASFVLDGVAAPPGVRVRRLGDARAAAARPVDGGLEIALAAPLSGSDAYAFEIHPLPEAASSRA
jgi:alpha-L-fucosidase